MAEQEYPDHQQLFEQFLKSNNLKLDDLTALKGDASRRKFYRTDKGKSSRIVIDADPALGEKPEEYAAITHLLRANSLSAPEIFAQDIINGFFIVDDFGDDLFTHLIQQDQMLEKDLYIKALNALIEVQNIKMESLVSFEGGMCRLRDYDVNLLISEVKIFSDWYFPYITNRPMPVSSKSELEAIMRGLLLPVVHQSQILVLRDFHADNLMNLSHQSNIKSVGMLDFQDAVIGNVAYDVVSLLQDARRTVTPEFEAEMLDYYVKQAKIQDTQAFMRDYYILGAQRNIKILGIFMRLWQRDNKDQYIAHINRVWTYLEADLAQPVLSPLQSWFDRWLPKSLRADISIA